MAKIDGYGPSLRCACDYVANSGLGAHAVAAVERENALSPFAGWISG
jgi:hypothetical protein